MMNYIEFSQEYGFCSRQIEALKRVFHSGLVQTSVLVTELSHLQQNWETYLKGKQEKFKSQVDVFAVLKGGGDWQVNMMYMLNLMKMHPELCEGKYRDLAVLFWQTAVNKDRNSRLNAVNKHLTTLAEIMTSYQACVWMLKETEKHDNFIMDFAQWMLKHDFRDEAVARAINKMKLDNMRRAEMIEAPLSEKARNLCELFNR